MAQPWIKLLTSIATNYRIAQVGPYGALVYIAVLIQHRLHGAGGRVPSRHVGEPQLRVETVSLTFAVPPQGVESALQACFDVGLLRREGDDVVIIGYDHDLMPQCASCHKPNEEHRFATCPQCRARSRGKKREGGEKAEKVRRRTGQDRTGQEAPPVGFRRGAAPVRGDGAEGRGRDAPRATDRPLDAEPRPIDDVDNLKAALMSLGFRSAVPNPRRGAMVRHDAERLAAQGLDPQKAAELSRLASRDGDDHDALLTHWLSGDAWPEVLGEEQSRQRLANRDEVPELGRTSSGGDQ